jgi:tripartite-type tricarboxylate transporter receptor subunit TctC
MKIQSARARCGLAGLAAVVFTAIVAGIAPAAAQDYPAQPIRLVIPYPPAGSTDIIARHFGNFLSKEMGQAVVVDNRPGAATNIGAEAVVKSKPDGYTLLFGANTQVLNPVFGPVPTFDLLSSLAPVSLVARMPFMVAANKNAPFSTPKELIAAAKAAPGKVSISSPQLDLYVELLKSRAGIDLLHIPYKGGAQATTDAISGQVDMVYALVPVLISHVQGGRLKALGLASAKRIAVLPTVPTFMESGVDYEATVWFGLFAPAGTPNPTVNRVFLATQKIVASAEFAEKVEPIGAAAVSSRPEEFRAQLVSETAFWKQVAKEMPKLVSPGARK